MMRRMKLFSRINFPWSVRQHAYSNNWQTKRFLSQSHFDNFYDFQELNAVYNLNLEKDIGQAHLLQVRQRRKVWTFTNIHRTPVFKRTIAGRPNRAWEATSAAKHHRGRLHVAAAAELPLRAAAPPAAAATAAKATSAIGRQSARWTSCPA